MRQVAASVDLIETPLVTLIRIGEEQDFPEGWTIFYTRIQQQHPGDFGVTLRLGKMLRLLGDSEGATRFLTAAVSIRPQSAFARSELGRALLSKGRVDEAIAAQREAIRLAPGEATYRLRMGIALLWKPGLEQDAAAAFSEATRVAQGAHGSRGAAGIQFVAANVYVQKGKLDEAITAYREAARLVPDDPHSRHHLGLVLDKKGLLDESIAAHRESARLQPQEHVAHSALAAVLNKKGLWDEAAGAYRAAIRLQPENAWLHHLLGDACAHAGRFAEAEAAFREAIRLEPNDGGRHHNLGDVLREQHKFGDASAEYSEAIRLRPEVHASHYGLGSVYAFCGQWDQAAPPFERAAELNPADLGSSYRWATLCVHNNDMEGYRRACCAMLDRFGETNDIQVADSTTRACALAPNLASDAMRVAKLVDLVLAGTEAHPARRSFEVTKALVEYRVGRFGSAAEAIGHLSPAGDGTHRDVLAFSILAMAQQRQGNVEDARTSMSKAQRILSTEMPDVAKGQTFGEDWHEWLHAQILCLEAEKLLKE